MRSGSTAGPETPLNGNEESRPNELPQTKANSTSLARTATGPRTAQGKERSKYNAVKHAILSKAVLLTGESSAELQSLLEQLREDHQPVGITENLLVEKMLTLIWRQRRLLTAESAVIAARKIEFIKRDNLPKQLLEAQELERLQRYEAHLDRAFDRTLNQLERLQRMRRGQPVPPPIKLQLSD